VAGVRPEVDGWAINMLFDSYDYLSQQLKEVGVCVSVGDGDATFFLLPYHVSTLVADTRSIRPVG
jgi:hypothetical protein